MAADNASTEVRHRKRRMAERAPDPQFKKRVITFRLPADETDFVDRGHVPEVVEFGRGGAGGGRRWAGEAAKRPRVRVLERAASVRQLVDVERAKFLVDWVFSPVIRGAFSTVPCFNHRVRHTRQR